jgi:ferric-dicitrate binding protein FerR (iron transport regulator)
MKMRAWKKVVLVLLAAVALVAIFVVWKVGPRNVYGLARYGTQRREGDLQVGQRAPDVTLVSLDGKSRVRLADEIGSKPLVLVFGSYT